MTETEKHPLEPFLPEAARILMLGSFPPKREKWSMDFFYPNFINDMWRILGIVFFGDRDRFIAQDRKHFDKSRIASFCRERHIALYDTAIEVIRHKGNASDKFLEVVSPTDIESLLDKIPDCHTIVTTGEKATEILCALLGCVRPKTGSSVEFTTGSGRAMTFYRMPSSSRAYPLSLDKKACIYRKMFEKEGFLPPLKEFTI